jgi:MFS transporter, NHS family, xanthosine permease
MTIQLRLTIVSFFQFFVWGAWLITIGTYCLNAKGWTFPQFGAIFSTLALSSLFMPAITGIIADKWVNAEKLYGVLHILYGAILFYVPQVNDPDTLYYVIFVAMICYMPTISLSNAIAYTILKREGLDVIKVFPPIRVWGTVGFIVAMWTTNLTGSKANSNQFIIAAIAAILLGLFAFTLPKCPPPKTISKDAGIAEQLGLKAFTLFKHYKMALFFIFSMLLGAALQLTNMYGDSFLSGFESAADYKESFVVKYSTIILSISQMSETLFILTIPFFLKRFGIKAVMLFSMIAWVLRFGFFAYGDPSFFGTILIILSCVVC